MNFEILNCPDTFTAVDIQYAIQLRRRHKFLKKRNASVILFKMFRNYIKGIQIHRGICSKTYYSLTLIAMKVLQYHLLITQSNVKRLDR